MYSPEALQVSTPPVPRIVYEPHPQVLQDCKSVHLAMIMNMQAANIIQIIEPFLCRVYPESPPQP